MWFTVIFTEFVSKPWMEINAPSIIQLPIGDIAKLEALLQQYQLPTQDCAAQARYFYGLYQDRILVAAGGLEPAGRYALLRSLVVSCHSQGRGSLITEFLLQQASTRGYSAVYLLTESASTFFARFGFTEILRQQVPVEIAATQQFTALCPDSACCMVLDLTPGRSLDSDNA